MNPEQIALLELIELLLSRVSEDPVYRHLKETIGGDEVFIEDTVTNVLLSTKRWGVVIDMERAKSEDVIFLWKREAAAVLKIDLKRYYILEMMAGL